MTMQEKIIEIFNFHTGRPSAEIVPTATFEDLGIDSLDCVEICMDIESSFDILISDEELDKLKTIQDVVVLVQSKLPAPIPPENSQRDENGLHASYCLCNECKEKLNDIVQ